MVARSIVELVERSDIIIGCSGHDCMHANFAECLKAINSTDRKNIPKIFISVSSKDIEFNSLLVHIQSNNRNGPINPLDNILYPKTNPKVIILGGGMPLNFLPVNKGISNHSIPLEDIQLTRGLLASAILQAYYMMENGNTNIAQQYQLDPYRQHFIVKSWCESNKKPMIKDFDSIDWIKKYSGNGKHWCQNKCSSLVPFKPNFI